MVKSNQKIRKAVHILLAILLLISALCITCIIILWARGAVIKSGYRYIPYGGGEFYFKGSKEEFIEVYENPYEDERAYLEFEYLGQKTESYYGIWDILAPDESGYNVDNNSIIIMTKNRKLEKVYYFLPVTEMKYLSQTEKEIEKKWEEKQIRKIRVVLKNTISARGQLFFYQVKIPENDIYTYEKVYAYEDIAAAAEFDLLIKGKEIPAIYVSQIEKNGEVNVSRYYKHRPIPLIRGGVYPYRYTKQY